MEYLKNKSLWHFLNRHLILSSVVLVAFILGLGYFLFFAGQWKRIVYNQEEDKAKAVELEDAVGYLKNLDVFYKNYTGVSSANMERLDQMFPSGEDMPDLLVSLEALAIQNGFKMLSVNMSPVKAADKEFAPGLSAVYPESFKKQGKKVADLKPNSLDIAITVAGGSYKDLKNFLSDIESSLRVLDVLGFNFAPKVSEYKINFRSYYWTK